MPTGIDGIVEQRIQEAQARGEFDGLPGQGKPLELDDDRLVPQEVRVAYRILKNAGCVPPEVEALRDAASGEGGGPGDGREDAVARRSRGARRLLAMRVAMERMGVRPSAALAQYRDRIVDRLGEHE